MDYTYIDSFILGLVQGLTEFLPISSSGHLVLAKEILNVNNIPLTFDIFFHFATLLAVLTWFRADITNIMRSFCSEGAGVFRGAGFSGFRSNADIRIVFYIVIGTIPAALAGLLFKDRIEELFNAPVIVSYLLIITGLVLLSTRWCESGSKEISHRNAIIIGIVQAFSLLPGISRSGTTITAGLWTGVKPELSAKFSFYLAIPAILGAVILEFSSTPFQEIQANLLLLLTGGIAAYISGYFAISLIMKVIIRGKFFFFGVYCLITGIISIILL